MEPFAAPPSASENEKPSLFALPTALLEHILHLTAKGPGSASTHLMGLYASCHAGRRAISSLISAATITMDGRQEEHGWTCGFPLLAPCMRRITLCMREGCRHAALIDLLADQRVRCVLARGLQELEVVDRDVRDGQSPARHGDLGSSLAAACPPSLQSLSFDLRSANRVGLAALAALSGLCSLTIRDHHGHLDGSSLRHLAALPSLRHLAIVLRIIPTQSPFSHLASLKQLQSLSLKCISRPDSDTASAATNLAQASRLSSLRHLTSLCVYDGFSEAERPSLPLHQYLLPIIYLKRLVRLKLPWLHLCSLQGITLLRNALPNLTRLEFYDLCCDSGSRPGSPHESPPSSVSSVSLRRIRFREFTGALDAHLLPLLQGQARIAVLPSQPPPALCPLDLHLGSASAPKAAATVAAWLRRAATALDTQDLQLTWDQPPSCAAASIVVAALEPLGRQVKVLWLDTWCVDEELVQRVAQVVPGLRGIGFRGEGTTLTSQAWQALLRLTELDHVYATCAPDMHELAAYVAAASRLKHVFLREEDALREGCDRAQVNARRREQGFDEVDFRYHW